MEVHLKEKLHNKEEVSNGRIKALVFVDHESFWIPNDTCVIIHISLILADKKPRDHGN